MPKPETTKEELIRLRRLIEVQEDLIASLRGYLLALPISIPSKIDGYYDLLREIDFLRLEGSNPDDFVREITAEPEEDAEPKFDPEDDPDDNGPIFDDDDDD